MKRIFEKFALTSSFLLMIIYLFEKDLSTFLGWFACFSLAILLFMENKNSVHKKG